MLSIDQKSEARIIAEIKDGNKEKLSELINKYEKKLFGFLFRMYPDYEIAKDLYQESWLRVVKNIYSFDCDRSFKSWLFGIALNLVKDKKRWDRVRLGREEPLENHCDTIMAIPESFNGKTSDKQLKLDGLLAKLPEKQREVLILRVYNEESEEKTAQMLGCSIGTVKSRLHYAIKSIKAKVGNKDEL